MPLILFSYIRVNSIENHITVKNHLFLIKTYFLVFFVPCRVDVLLVGATLSEEVFVFFVGVVVVVVRSVGAGVVVVCVGVGGVAVETFLVTVGSGLITGSGVGKTATVSSIILVVVVSSMIVVVVVFSVLVVSFPSRLR